LADLKPKEDKEVSAFLQQWDGEQKMGDKMDIELNKLYRVELVSTFDGTSEETGNDYTGYRLSQESPVNPNGVFFLSGVSRKTMNEYLQFNWKDLSTAIKLKFVKTSVAKPGKKDYHVIKCMVVDKF
jgi:hypothetical protein